MIEIDVEIYETSNGKRPFEEWIKDIREVHTRAKILTRIDRLKMGNFGDCKTLQDGVCELRIHYGPGIRIYYPGGTWLNDVVEDIVVVRKGAPENLTPLGAGLDLR